MEQKPEVNKNLYVSVKGVLTYILHDYYDYRKFTLYEVVGVNGIGRWATVLIKP